MRHSPTQPIANLTLLGCVVVALGCRSADNEYVAPPPPEVTVVVPLQQRVTPFTEENGVIEAVKEAEVRARVQGFVEQIQFQPGALVAAGDVLYQIESDQYEAIVNSARAAVQSAEAGVGAAHARVATAEAEVKVTEQNLNREQRLLDRQAGSQADLDTAVAANDSALATLDSAKANVQVAISEKSAAEASLAQAQLDLNYTRVQSPIGGRITTTNVKQGNLVENGTKLAAVIDRTNVWVNFSVSDRDMLRFVKNQRDALQPGEEFQEANLSEVPVYLKREIDEGYIFVGALDYVEQQGVDAETGTFGMRALFENGQDLLFPGLFVSVRVPSGVPTLRMLIPEHAIQRDQVGSYVLTVDDQNKVRRTPLTIAQTNSGWAVVSGGLSADTLIVIDGIQQARPGLEVTVTKQELSVADETLLRGLSPADAINQAGQPSSPVSQPADE